MPISSNVEVSVFTVPVKYNVHVAELLLKILIVYGTNMQLQDTATDQVDGVPTMVHLTN